MLPAPLALLESLALRELPVQQEPPELLALRGRPVLQAKLASPVRLELREKPGLLALPVPLEQQVLLVTPEPPASPALPAELQEIPELQEPQVLQVLQALQALQEPLGQPAQRAQPGLQVLPAQLELPAPSSPTHLKFMFWQKQPAGTAPMQVPSELYNRV